MSISRSVLLTSILTTSTDTPFELVYDKTTGWGLESRFSLTRKQRIYVQISECLSDLTDADFELFCKNFSQGVSTVHASLKQIQELTKERLEKMGTALRLCEGLTQLSFSFNNLGALDDVSFERLVEDIAHCRALESLSLVGTNLVSSATEKHGSSKKRLMGIRKILNWCENLEELNLALNNLCFANGMAFVELSQVLPRPTLTTLDLSNNDFKLLESGGLAALGRLWSKFPNLRTLKLSKINLGALSLDEITQLGKYLSNFKNLQELELDGNDLANLGLLVGIYAGGNLRSLVCDQYHKV